LAARRRPDEVHTYRWTRRILLGSRRHSIVIFLVLFLFCSPGALVFTWLTAWKTDSKVIVTLLMLAPGVIYLFLVLTGIVPAPR
jgi:hypothetical protein